MSRIVKGSKEWESWVEKLKKPKPPRTQEHRNNLSNARKGIPWSDEERASRAKGNFGAGWKHNDEAKEKIRKYRKANPQPPDVIAKMAKTLASKNPIDKRFWSRVRKDDSVNGCWVWIGSRDKDGYGYIWTNKKGRRAHVLSFIMAYGDILGDLHVLHKCDNPPCVNPEHLYSGSEKDNARDRQERGRGNNQWTTSKNKKT